MKRVLYAIAALLLLALGAVLLAPASLVDGWLRERTQGRLALTHSEGTVWNGNGELSVSLPDGRLVALPGMRWKVSAWSLLGGAVEGEVSETAAGGDPIRGAFRVERNSTRIHDLALTIPAEALAALAVIATFAPAGQVAIEIVSLRWAPPHSTGGGSIRWRQANLLLPADSTRVALGTVEAQFTARGDHVVYTLRNDGGDVTLAGDGEWHPGGRPSINATLRSNPGTPESLALALSRMGMAADGSVPLRLPSGLPAAR